MFLVKLFGLNPAASKIRFSPYLARLTGISISKYATWGNGHRDIKGTGNGVTKDDLQSEVGGKYDRDVQTISDWSSAQLSECLEFGYARCSLQGVRIYHCEYLALLGMKGVRIHRCEYLDLLVSFNGLKLSVSICSK